MGKYSGSGGSNNQEKPQSNSSGHKQTYQALMEKYNPEVNEDYVNRFIKDANAFVGKYGNDVGYITGRNIYDKNSAALDDLNTRARILNRYFKENAKQYENPDQVTENFASIKSALEKYGSYLKGQQDYYSQWDTEDDYNAFLDYDAKSKFDLKKGQKEIDDLESLLEKYKGAKQGADFIPKVEGKTEMESLMDLMDSTEKEISQKKQYLNQAKCIQESITLSGVAGNALSGVAGNSDFWDLSKYSTTIGESTSWWQGRTEDTQYEWINNQNGFRDDYERDMDTLNEVAAATSQSSFYTAPTESVYRKKGYDKLNKNEIAIYNYYYAKEGKDKAQEYLDSIQETLNVRKANEMYGELKDNTAQELIFGLEAGLDQFASGVQNLFNREDDYIPQSAVQMTSGMVREDLADAGAKLPKWLGGASLGQAGYDLITTSANMAPSMLASIGIGILNPTAGAIAGNALMGASAAGNAYQEALNQGYDKGQARAYSTMIGASEAILGEMLGGISKLGGTSKAVTNLLNGVDNAFYRFIGKVGGSFLSEGLEEGLQEVLSPMFSNFFLHTDEDINWSEVAYSALLGGFSALGMDGPVTVAGEVNTYSTGRQLQNAGVTAQQLSDIGNKFSADTVAYQLAGRVNEDTGAYTMGRLFNEIGATMTEQNVNDITKALVLEGIPEKIARNKANLMARIVEGAELTEAGIQAIEADTLMSRVMKTTFVDSNSTWFQRANGYKDVLKAMAQEMTAPKASRTNPAQQGEENAPASDKVDTQNKKAAEGSSEADIPEVKAKSISTIKDGQVTVKMEDGSEVDIAEAGLDPEDGVLIETIAKIGGISAQDANFILGTLKATPSVSAQVSALGAKEAYQYGFYGFSQDHIAKHGVFANSLSEPQRQSVYETGRQARAKQTEAKQATVAKNAKVANKMATDGKKVGKVHFDGDRSKLTARQSASLTAMEKVADIMGVQIHVFESKVGANGKRIGANGWYDPTDNSIHVDLHSGANGEGTMLFTLSHELTHHIRKWSPEKFQILSDFLMEEYGKKGVNVDALVRKQQEKAKRNGRTISYDTAWEEVVADSMETMLADGNVLNRLEKLKAKDKDLWYEIKRFINDLADKIRAAYKGMTPDSVEGRMVADMGKTVYRLQELFAEALYDASENYQASLTPGEESVVVNQNGDPVAYSNEEGSVLLSMRTYEEEGREAFRKYLDKCVKSKKLTKAEMQDMLDGIEEIYGVCKEFKDKYAPFSSWSDAAVVRDTFGKPVFSVVTPNGDYKMNLDFSLVCKKRRTLDAVFNEMSRRGIIDDFELGQKSVVKINEIIRKYGLETACALCFVDAKRFRQAAMADTFTSLYNELVQSLVPEDQRSNIAYFNFAGYATIKRVEGGIDTWDNSKLDFSHINHVLKTYGDGTVEYKAAKYIKNHPEGRKLLLRGDFMSSQGFDAVKTQNQDIMKLYNSKKGTGGPKAAFGDVQYMNEVIQKARWWTPKKAYAVGGVRIQSFSDYVPRMVFDYTQMIYDLAATKLPAHAYTKEALFVKQFGLTGVKINMSLIPAIAEGGIAPGLDANGDYVWAGESFDFETAKEIQNAEGYTENCGTICVGVSKQHILKLLSDPNIRMVIPYHKSGLNPIVAHMNKIAEFTDYTTLQTNPGGCQNTMNKNGSKVEEDFNFNEVLRKTGDPKATVRQYLDWCAKNEYTPRFAEFAWHENYYKLIEDFTLYDKDGNYVPQREVRAVFPKADSAFGSMKELIQEGLQEDAIVEGKRDKSLSKIVDEIQETLPQTEGEIPEEQVAQADRDLEELKLSDRPYSYETLTSKPDMKVTLVGGNAPKNRADVVAQAKKNAAKVGKFNPKDGSVSVHVNDINRDVVLGTAGLKHSLDRRMDVNASITLMAGEILQNSIKINELTPQKAEADESYVLIGAARNSDGELHIVRSVVNRFSNELASMDVLYAINAKKENRLRSMRPGFQGPVTDSIISIADLLDHVNQYFPEVLPEDVLKHYGHDARPEGKLGESALYSDRDTAPTFYSHMARVVDGVKQEKLGAASVVSMLRGKGVKAEEIKWSGIEAFLEGKKSVTKAELQQFIAGSMLQIEEETLTDKEMPYSQERLDQIAKFEAERDIIAETLKSEWKRIVGTDIPIVHFGAGLESAVVNNLILANSTVKDSTEVGYKYKAARAALQRVVENSDDYYGYDNARQALREAMRDPKGFMDSMELTSFEKSVFRDFFKAKEAYRKLEGIPVQDQQTLKAIAESADRFNSRINRVKQAHYAEAAKHLTKWSQYKIRGGYNYREVLFKIPGSYYTNAAMGMHWEEKSGVLAHARIQDLNTFLGRMLFVEEIQSDWHNDGRKDGYASEEQAVRKKVKDLEKQWDSLMEESMTASATRSYAINEKLDAIDEEKNRLESKLRFGELAPDAPFSDNYHEYVLKRLIRMAAEQDYDSIGWTPAQIQVDRWSKKFAEAYRIEYDQDIPKFLNKYGKKWGTKVGKTVLDSGTEVWSMAITDEMKESVLTDGQPLYSERDTESVSNRSLLANAFEGVAQNDIERNKIQEYKGKISLIESEERKLSELNEKIKELSFAKGPKDTKKIRDLQFEAKQTANRISTYDKQLLRLEASKPLQDVLTREKKMAYQRAEKKGKEALEAYREKATKTQRELMDRYEKSRKWAKENREKTAMRHKIKNVVNDLNQYLLKGTKDRHVPIGLQKAVAEALNAVNMDTVGAEERIAKLEAELLKAKTPEQIREISKKIDHIREMGDNMSGKLKRLKEAYDDFLNSDDPLIANSHDDGLSAHMMTLIVRVGDTPLRDMSLSQLQDVYDVYKIVLATVRNANKSFKDNKNREISTRANQVMAEIDNLGIKRGKRLPFMDWVEKFGWNNLKPVYAMEHIGSQGLIDAFNNVRSGEDVWATDVTEAREYYLEKFRQYHYDSWDFEKKSKFTSTTGKNFELTLDQIMSLYAYSKRDQAADHLKYGGIVFDPKTEVVEKTKHGIKVKYNVANATAYNISEEILADIISKLTPEQKSFVDEMQAYLSDVMGAKGNEVSLAMYDVKLFKEKNYFPLKSAHQYMAKAKEQAQGEVKIKNSGFSKETKPHAKNPIVLSSFMDVWSNHVNEMSMYHAFVLPMEDFYRIYNYTTPSKNENMPTEGVNAYIENAYGSGATGYIEQMLKDLNGGARSDSTTGFINKMMGMYKKGAVFASLSVVVQQPSAIARAAALVDTKYFIGAKIDHKRHDALWNEVKQYAPVAIIKEMGYFDTNMGKSTRDFIMGKEYSGLKNQVKAFFAESNYRDEVLSKAPAWADEMAWCSIWEAVKRETKAKNPGMKVNSDEFLTKAGERFTEVITKTQVYDSVLSRSANMRSKDTGMKMATAFMAEPTTSINMIADALLKGKRGNRKYARAAIGAVIASQILNSILVSFVYAARDDDEDETYWEKYIGNLTGEILDGLNPAGYIPFIKDIMSIVQGYDVERSDMAVISDLWKAWENLKKDDVSVYRKVEGFAGSIAQIFGLPVKNIMRDARAIWQTIAQPVMDKANGIEREKGTKAGIGYAVKSSAPKWLGGGDVSNRQQLYEAILSGDNAQIARVKGRFKDQSAINSAIRKALRENDPRIRAAAEARFNGNLSEYTRIAKQIIGEKHFSQDDVVAAINAEINAMDKEESNSGTQKASGLYKTEDFAVAVSKGDSAMANAIKTDIIQTAQKNGKTADEAEKSFNSSASGACKELFLEGKISESKAVDALVAYCGIDQNDAEERVGEWAFQGDYGFAWSDRGDAYINGTISASELRTILMEVGGKTEEEADLQIQAYDWEAEGYEGATAAAVRDYNEYCASADVPKDVYLHIRKVSNNTENDVDRVTGKTIYYSAMKKVMAEIGMQTVLTRAQKYALAKSLGWSEKNIQKYKTW